MDFVENKMHVECIRRSDCFNRPLDQSHVVVRFDSQLNTVAPHVAAKLYESEVSELEQWLQDRALIRERSTEKTLVNLLPKMIEQSIIAISAKSELDIDEYIALLAAIDALLKALRGVEVSNRTQQDNVEIMKDHEVLKTQIDLIKFNL